MELARFKKQLLYDQNVSEVFGPERLEALAAELARSQEIVEGKTAGIRLLPEVRKKSKELIDSYLLLNQEVHHHGQTPASDWFLDNFHIIEDQLRSIKRDLPKNYYDELPKIKEGPHKGYPRVYALAENFVSHTDCKVELAGVKSFVEKYQEMAPLTIGELWAVPITFRISLINQLCPLVERILVTHRAQEEADALADKILEMASKLETRPEDMVNFLSEKILGSDHCHRAMIVQLIQRLRDQDPGISHAFDWLEDFLKSSDTSTGEIVQLEHFRQAMAQVTIGNIITSMRMISKIDWHDFFEDVSFVNRVLVHDPTDTYTRMDRATRDSYRKVIERISRRTRIPEEEVARTAIMLAAEFLPGDPTETRKKHVGHYLLGPGVFYLEEKLGYRSPLKEKLARFFDEDPAFVYFGSIFLVMVFAASILLKLFPIPHQTPLKLLAFLALILIPVSELAISAVNFFATLIRKPKRLPRMNTEKGLRAADATMVVVPCLLPDALTVQALVRNLEVQYLANQDPAISFALLGDLTDADAETTPKDAALLTLAQTGIDELNRKYQAESRPRFFFFHRSRLYNEAEGKWIAWERKRGKILEFNRLLRGDRETTFLTPDVNFEFLKSIRYVITLDADTQLPLNNARKLVGTITHPLNSPVYSEETKSVISGYGILQPRIGVSMVSAARTRFARIFSGNTGIDPYTTAISDVYQDLFQEGSFTGKGLYDVDVFEKVLGDRIPENTVLSHDLLEGSYTRAGLTTDIEFIDDYPTCFEVYSKRLHRWTRGDWQIALWLFPFVQNAKKEWVRNTLPLVARWKILDNLRRSLLAPATFLWFLLSWTVLHGKPLAQTVAIILTLSFPVYAPSFTDLLRKGANTWKEHLLTCLKEIRNRLYQVFLMVAFMPAMALDQVDAIIRSLYRMLVSRRRLLEWVTFSQTQNLAGRGISAKSLVSGGPLAAVLSAGLIFLLRPDGVLPASPFLLIWGLAPGISLWSKERPKPKEDPLEKKEIRIFRRYGRMTWHFFEAFAREESNWLAPDNFQEDPRPVVAHRTSPTNIGLQLLSTLTAFDLGYVGFRQLVELLEHTLAAVVKLEKFNGHLYNWYDTQTLAPLFPHYVSSVDSGNLAGHLLTLRQACLGFRESAQFHNPHANQGMKDTITVLKERITGHCAENPGLVRECTALLNALTPLLGEKNWERLVEETGRLHQKLSAEGAPETVMRWARSLQSEAEAFHRDHTEGPRDLPERLDALIVTSEKLFTEMDFAFLFNPERKIFHIGFNASDGRLDDSYYDLLASESRLLSLVAIAKGDAPDEHWFRLGRQVTKVGGSRALVSWSASMFEYLMPLIVMRRYEGTLLDQTYDSVVLRQMEYGNQRSIPWGVSEAGYNARDINFNYQYGPFGVPGLGLKRGLRDELVISPYSSMLAALVFPRDSLKNLQKLEDIRMLGGYGFYESIDYTAPRLPKNEESIILRSYMAHHQGMSLVSINNILNKSIMQKRFHSDPRIKAVELLLQEKIPVTAEITKPRAEETHLDSGEERNDGIRIYTDPNLSIPRTQMLSNGNYSVMLTSAGSGFSRCEGRMVTRWREDPTQDNWGQYIYLQNMKSMRLWSSGYLPTHVRAESYEAHFAEDKVEFLREDAAVSTHTEVIISSEDNVELRRISLTNNSSEVLEIELTSYMEVVMARGDDDAAHPAFSNLFIQTEFLPSTQSLLAHRRRRSEKDPELWGLHLLTVEEGETVGEVQFETDRFRFLGRGRSPRNPIVLSNEIGLSNTQGAVLDPIFSLRRRVRIPPRKTARVSFATGLVYSREEALRVTQKYHDRNIFLRQLNLGWVKSQMALRHLGVTHEKAHLYQRLGGRLLYLAPYLRAQGHDLLANRKSQSALWAYGISGDLPIILTQIQNEKDLDMVRELLKAHEYLLLKGLRADLVILNERATSYLQHLNDELMRQIRICGLHSLIDRPGGIFIRKADQIPREDLLLLKSVARVILFANKGTLGDQLRRRAHDVELPAKFLPTAQKKGHPRGPSPQEELQFFNGLGGFSPDGREYVISLKDDQWTPAPWVNVVANENDFGFVITESGQGYTWSVNSRENRLTPWSNDPVSDPSGEAIYLRDEETGAVWSPTPLPIRGAGPYVIRHGHGQSVFELQTQGIAHQLTLFVPRKDPVKIVRLKLRNLEARTRNISVTHYVEWVLGFSREKTAQTLTTEWDHTTGSVLARNFYNNEFAQRVAFLTNSLGDKAMTSDRKEFIGRNGSLARPEALKRQTLSGKIGCGFDQCGAIQSRIELGAGEEKEIVFLLGQGKSDDEVAELIARYNSLEGAARALDEVRAFWDEILGALVIKTPDPSMDLLVNRWLLYQTLSCRIWGRSAFYQSGGAFGFRDQLQDVMAMVYSHPELTREQIKLAASRQFPEGDVQHWWHPPTGRGVRTRFSDDLLWLPFVTGFYVAVTGDRSILEELVPFIETPVLQEGHDETYTQPEISSELASVFDHCLRTLDRSLELGAHGLPLMGSGDWNDGMNRVGNLGKGESVWLAWFLIKTLKDFIPLCEEKGEAGRVKIYREHVEKLKGAIEENAWDGQWYLRAYYDNGEKLGSKESQECQIDAIAQSWSVLSGAGETQHATTALQAVNNRLIDRQNKIIKLFTPPFDKTSADPGYIKGYVPGVRENGGQYTHAAIWTMMAYAALGQGETAVELFSLINPINRSDTHTGAFNYKVEPYVISADIYGVEPHVGRGGWSWYTGSASWMYRAAIEAILGLELSKNKLRLRPNVPASWESFQITYRREKTTFHITYLNQGPLRVELDGEELPGDEVELSFDGKEHRLVVQGRAQGFAPGALRGHQDSSYLSDKLFS